MTLLTIALSLYTASAMPIPATDQIFDNDGVDQIHTTISAESTGALLLSPPDIDLTPEAHTVESSQTPMTYTYSKRSPFQNDLNQTPVQRWHAEAVRLHRLYQSANREQAAALSRVPADKNHPDYETRRQEFRTAYNTMRDTQAALQNAQQQLTAARTQETADRLGVPLE